MTKRPTLSDLLPAKGAAARAEPMPDQPPTPPAPAPAPDQRAEPGSRAKPRVVRVPVTVKITEAVYRRLREAAHREERDKQDLVDEALDALLSKMGY